MEDKAIMQVLTKRYPKNCLLTVMDRYLAVVRMARWGANQQMRTAGLLRRAPGSVTSLLLARSLAITGAHKVNTAASPGPGED